MAAQPSWPARAFAWVLVKLRWLVLVACLVGVGAAVLLLPAVRSSGLGDALSVVPRGAASLQTEKQVLQDFHLPLLSRTVIVERDPHGLSLAEQLRIVALAVRLDRHQSSGAPKVPGSGDIAGALPVLNTFGLFPSASEDGTTALLYLFSPLSVSVPTQVTQAQDLAHRYLGRGSGAYVGVTGVTAAQQQQGQLAAAALDWVELAAAAVIALVVGLKFRCIGAPVAALLTAGIAYEVSTRLIAWAGQRFGFTVPGELEPLIAVLVAGVSTDYSIFFLSRFRDRLRENVKPHEAAQQAIAAVAPIVAIAGISVAASTAALGIADLSLFRHLGPGMAVSVAISALSALLFLTASLACAGRAIFWPGHRPKPAPSPASPERIPPSHAERPGLRRRVLAYVVANRPLAAATLIAAVAVLGAGAYGLSGIGVGTDLIADLPSDSPATVAAQQVAAGFAPGTVAPTELLLHGGRLDARRPALGRLDDLLAAQPGVAGVLGPDDVSSGRGHNVLLTTTGSAARYIIFLSYRPYGAPAISTLHQIEVRLPSLLSRAGLTGVHTGVTGDTALSGTIVTVGNHDLVRVALLVLGILLLILVIFLRALLAPLLLLAATVLSVLATLGVTSWLFQDVLDAPGLTFYVPFASAVLLLSFGSDYNIFLVGRIWQLDPKAPLRDRVVDGTVSAGRAITTAGITLALSFALLAIVQLGAFREFAFAMFLGVLLDTFVVRSVIVPALLALLGPAAGWPSRRLRSPDAPAVDHPA